MRALRVRSRHRGQAIIEFGLIAILFTSLMFAVVDFGLLLNTWLSVSSATREIARNASVGHKQTFLKDEAHHLAVPAISANGFSGYCCDVGNALEVRVEYFSGPGCTPWSGCAPVSQNTIDPRYPYLTVDQSGTAVGCTPTSCHPQPDDYVRVTIYARGAQVITPLVRAAVGCTNGSNPNCNFLLTGSVVTRFEGREF